MVAIEMTEGQREWLAQLLTSLTFHLQAQDAGALQMVYVAADVYREIDEGTQKQRLITDAKSVIDLLSEQREKCRFRVVEQG